MRYGRSTSRQRPHNAACSSRTPSVKRKHPVPCQAIWADPQDSGQVAQAPHDAPMGPRLRRSSVLTPAEEAMVVEFRRQTLLPLDDVLGGAENYPDADPKIHTVLTDNGMACRSAEESHRPNRHVLRPYLRPHLRREQYQAPPDQTLPSMDQRPSRTHEPHHQGRDGEDLPLPRPGEPQGPYPNLRHGI